MHIRHYEQLHVQYLETVRQGMQASASGLLPPHQPFPRWNDPSGYAGYVPMHRFFRCFFNSLIERHAAEMDQHMAMQSAETLNHDHSFKVTGILGKVNGVATFGALHTACNDYGECRKMTLTPTKEHDDCMPALAEIPVTLVKYGHAPVKILFTDNVRGDRSALERAFPSLLYSVNPVPSLGLEDLVVPDGWHELHVAFDLEWPVDRETGIYGRVSLVSLAYDKAMYLILISQYVQDNGFLKLPSSLLVVLCSKRVRKIGVQVKADLTHLYKDCGFADSTNEQPFIGALKLGSMAKDQNVTDHMRISLADLTALVLHRNLPKDASIRVSTKWDDPVLSPEQEKYAALDVYAASAIFESFSAIPSCGPVTLSMPVGIQVQLMSRNGGLAVAYGHIARHQPKQLDGVNVSKTRIVITVTAILVPAYLVRADLRPNHQETPILNLATKSPFPLLCYQRDLRTCIRTSETTPQNSTTILPSSPYEPHDSPYLQVDEIEDLEPTTDLDLASDAEKDLHGLSQIESLAELVSRNVTIESNEVRSRVLGDIWHLMDQFKISIHHGLRRPFSRALQDAIFLPDPVDLAAVKEVLKKRNTCFRQMVLTNSDWVWQRIKRLVPPPEILAPRVTEVLQTYGPLKDAVTGQPLFNDASWEKAHLVIENIKLGYYSDSPGHHFYTLQRTDKLGLNIYRCSRGTNNVEGGIHQNIIRRFGSFNASPQLTVNLLRDYTLMHNLEVGTVNRTGKIYLGSYDIWTRNQIVLLVDTTASVVRPSYQECSQATWLNGNDFEPANESFGILPVAAATRAKLGMSQYRDDYAKGCKIKHEYLARHQQTLVAILPIHTVEEKALYCLLIKSVTGQFAGQKQPNWVALAQEWQHHANGTHIFYKLPEQLKSYYKTWNEHQNEHNSVEQNNSAYLELQKLLAAPVGMPEIAPAPRQTVAEQVDGHQASANEEPTDWQISVMLGRNGSRQTLLQLQYSDPALPGPHGQKQPAEEEVVAPVRVKQRAQRTCKSVINLIVQERSRAGPANTNK
ncbi:hypothetical protein C8R48DRAFT_768098 [Suillus tomentosus]|nr:hypothetical protein C8R48DRAFT_768098 [Suillus tomentosus]